MSTAFTLEYRGSRIGQRTERAWIIPKGFELFINGKKSKVGDYVPRDANYDLRPLVKVKVNA